MMIEKFARSMNDMKLPTNSMIPIFSLVGIVRLNLHTKILAKLRHIL